MYLNYDADSRSFSGEATCLRILFEYHAQSMLECEFISLNFARDRNESSAKRSMRIDFSLLDKFSRFPPISILRILIVPRWK